MEGTALLLMSVWTFFGPMLDLTFPMHKITALLILVISYLDFFFTFKNKQNTSLFDLLINFSILNLIVGVLLMTTNNLVIETYLLIVSCTFLFTQNLATIKYFQGYGKINWRSAIFLCYLCLTMILILFLRLEPDNIANPYLGLLFFIAFLFKFGLFFKMRKLNTFPEKVSFNVYSKIEMIEKEYSEALSKNWDADRDLYM